MQIKVTETGLAELRKFLIENHTNGHLLGDEEINAWACDAENQVKLGNAPSVKISAFFSLCGHTDCYTLSRAGYEVISFEGAEDD